MTSITTTMSKRHPHRQDDVDFVITTSTTRRCRHGVVVTRQWRSRRRRRRENVASSLMRRPRRRSRRYDVDVITTLTTTSASLSWRQSRLVNVVVTSWLRRATSPLSRDDNVKTTSTSLQRHEDVASWMTLIVTASMCRCRHDADDVEAT